MVVDTTCPICQYKYAGVASGDGELYCGRCKQTYSKDESSKICLMKKICRKLINENKKLSLDISRIEKIIEKI